MARLVSRSIVLVLFGIVGLALAPSAYAGIKLTATVKGEDVLPEAAEYLRKARRWMQQARIDHHSAQRHRDWRTVEAIEYEWRKVEHNMRIALDDIRVARTQVVLYGDAAQRLQAIDVVNQLRGTGAWEHRTVHFWYERGKLYWGTSAPRGGYDNSNTLQAQAPYEFERTERHADDRAPPRRFDWSAAGRARRMGRGGFGF